MAEISIILPVFNTEKYLERCLNSIAKQTFKDYSLIIINDGSTDNSKSICEKYKANDNRIVLLNQKNKGLSAVRNTGIEYVRKKTNSKYFCFIDSDDYVGNHYLEYLYKAVKESIGLMAACSFMQVSSDDVDYEDNFKLEEKDIKKYYIEHNTNSTVAWNKLYLVSDFDDIAYPNGKINEDEATTFKVLFKHKSIAYVDTPLYFYYVNPESITNKKFSIKNLDRLDALKEKIKYFVDKDNELYIHDVKKLITSSIRYYRNIKNKYPEYKYLNKKLTTDIRKWLIYNNNQNSKSVIQRFIFSVFVYAYWIHAKLIIYSRQ